MMTAKARGKDLIVLFDESTYERPDSTSVANSRVRSIAHLKMLQSLAGKLNRLNDVREIGEAIVDELRMLIDYHNCSVYLLDGEVLHPVAVRGENAADIGLTIHPHPTLSETLMEAADVFYGRSIHFARKRR